MAEEKDPTAFAEMHNKMSLVASYPPFSLDEDVHKDFLMKVRCLLYTSDAADE